MKEVYHRTRRQQVSWATLMGLEEEAPKIPLTSRQKKRKHRRNKQAGQSRARNRK
jgi:hypothetical protein